MAIPGSFQYPQAPPGQPAPVAGTPATPGQVGAGGQHDWWRALLAQLGITLPQDGFPQGGFPQVGRGFNFRTANRQPRPAPQFTGVPRSTEGGFSPQQTPVESLAAAPRVAEQVAPFGPVTPKNGIYLPDSQSRFSTMGPASWLSNYLRG